MNRSVRLTALLSAALLAVGCSSVVSGSDSDLSPDASTPSPDGSSPGDNPDAAGTPDPVVFAAPSNPADFPEFFGAVATSSSEVALFYSNADGARSVTTWERGRWNPRVFGPASTRARVDTSTASEIDGRPVWIDANGETNNPSAQTRYWRQLADGSFTASAPIPNNQGFVSATNFNPSTGVFAAAAGDAVNTVFLFERDRQGNWSSAEVVHDESAGYLWPEATGWMRDGSAFVLVRSATGLASYRRKGTSWSKVRDLVTTPEGGLVNMQVAVPSEGGEAALIAYLDPYGSAVKAMRLDLASGEVSNPASLLSNDKSPWILAAISRDGRVGRILIAEPNLQNLWMNHVWTASMDGSGAFSKASPLRADLVFDAAPFVLYHPSAGFLILHQTRRPGDRERTGPALLESLDTFATSSAAGAGLR